MPRLHYGVHSQALKLYIQLGLVLGKVHRVLAFRQEPFLKAFILRCKEMRKNSKTKFESNLWKLINNAVYGKTSEQVRNYLQAIFTMSIKHCRTLFSSPRFTGAKILHENLIVSFMRPSSVVMSKPIAIGFTVLEHAKTFMYREYYMKLFPLFNGAVTCLYSDTDSLVLKICGTAERAIDRMHHMLDTSNYPESHPKFSNARKKRAWLLEGRIKRRAITNVRRSQVQGVLHGRRQRRRKSKRAESVQRIKAQVS